MTDTITLEDAFKSKAKFSEYFEKNTPEEITSTLAQYPKSEGKVIVQAAELTQNIETFVNIIGSDIVQNLPKAPYFVWTVTNPKESIMNTLKTINEHSTKGFGIFVFKATLNEDKMDIECILKPEIPAKTIRNENTPAKLLQKEYWEQYFEICDELQSEMQVTPAPRHYQYISMGKAGVQIVQTVNTKDNYAATEIMINNNKEIFNKLLENKSEIEEKLGNLDWQSLEGKKSSRIRKSYNADIANPESREETIKNHIKMAEDFRETFRKYL